MLIMSVIVYFLSYSPQQVLLIYDTFKPSQFHENWTVHVFTMIIAYINSAANPILYSIFSQNFRKNFHVGFPHHHYVIIIVTVADMLFLNTVVQHYVIITITTTSNNKNNANNINNGILSRTQIKITTEQHQLHHC